MHENVIEWLDGEDTVSVTLHQKRFISRVRRLAENKGNNVVILNENPDGSIFAHLPISCLNLRQKPLSRSMSEEEKEELTQRLQEGREKKQRNE